LIEVLLPGGVPAGGERRQDAVLRPVSGADEAFLLEGDALSPVERTTALLARCVARVGAVDSPGEDGVRALAAGDREALLLHLRRVTLGERLELLLCCPDCGAELDLDLSVRELLVPSYADWAPEHTLELDGIRVRFRLPTGADLEAAARVAVVDLERAPRLVLERCVLSVDGTDTLPASAGDALSRRMAELDPQAELVLEMPCAECGHHFSVQLDAGELLARELAGRSDVLLREIHLLASHYGWAESELLAMSSRRRRRYAAFLTEAIAG
jgi:hypothetical protein